MGLIKYIGYKVGMLLLQLQLHLEYPGVEHYHHQAGDVEGAQAGPDDEVRVVEGADDGLVLDPLRVRDGVVQGQSLVNLEIIIVMSVDTQWYGLIMRHLEPTHYMKYSLHVGLRLSQMVLIIMFVLNSHFYIL